MSNIKILKYYTKKKKKKRKKKKETKKNINTFKFSNIFSYQHFICIIKIVNTSL